MAPPSQPEGGEGAHADQANQAVPDRGLALPLGRDLLLVGEVALRQFAEVHAEHAGHDLQLHQPEPLLVGLGEDRRLRFGGAAFLQGLEVGLRIRPALAAVGGPEVGRDRLRRRGQQLAVLVDVEARRRGEALLRRLLAGRMRDARDDGG